MKPFLIFLFPVLATGSLLSTAVAQTTTQQVAPAPTAVTQTSSQPTGQPAAAMPSQGQPVAQQWVSSSSQSQSTGFPAAPGAQQTQAAFPQSNYGPGNYAVAGSAPGTSPNTAGQNGVAAMPPLSPPGSFEQAQESVSPFSNEEIVKLRQQLDASRKAKAYRPVRALPRISSISVDLSPGSALPILRTLPGETSTLVFVDSTGAPWPIVALPRVSDARYFDVEWLQGTPSVVISALSAYEDGNLTVFLQGLATPVVVKLSTGEPDSQDKTRVVDYRLDLRVPGRGPNAKAPLLGPGKIALYDSTMQDFLDGIPPKDAKLVAAHGDIPARTQIWQYDGAMFVRTSLDIQTAFDQSIASGDGTRVYRLPPTPYVTLSEMGRSVTVQLDIN